MKIEVDGVELTITRTASMLRVARVVGRDRKAKKDIINHVDVVDDGFLLLRAMRRVAKWTPEGCTCTYGYGWSDHDAHCKSIYKAQEYVDFDD
jgi:hypothetical protein